MYLSFVSVADSFDFVGIGYDRPWRYRRVWDQFAIPKPYSRARVICSPRLQIPADLERDQIEEQRVWVEQTLNGLCLTAERWAAGELQLEERPLIVHRAGRRLAVNVFGKLMSYDYTEDDPTDTPGLDESNPLSVSQLTLCLKRLIEARCQACGWKQRYLISAGRRAVITT